MSAAQPDARAVPAQIVKSYYACNKIFIFTVMNLFDEESFPKPGLFSSEIGIVRRSSAHVITAVYIQDMPGDVARHRGGEKERRVDNLVRVPEPA